MINWSLLPSVPSIKRPIELVFFLLPCSVGQPFMVIFANPPHLYLAVGRTRWLSVGSTQTVVVCCLVRGLLETVVARAEEATCVPWLEMRRRDIVRSRSERSPLLIRVVLLSVVGIEVGRSIVIEEWRNRQIHAHDPPIELFLVYFFRNFFHPLPFDLLVVIFLPKTTRVYISTPVLESLSTLTTFLTTITKADVIFL